MQFLRQVAQQHSPSSGPDGGVVVAPEGTQLVGSGRVRVAVRRRRQQRAEAARPARLTVGLQQGGYCLTLLENIKITFVRIFCVM